MSASILDAIQDLATPAMINAAVSTLGVSEAAATSTLAAASTSVLGGLIQKSGDASVMAKVATLIGGMSTDASIFSNLAGILSSGLPSSPAHTMGNKLLGLAFGDKEASMIAAVASATGVSPKVASGLTTLAAPMVLASLRSKLGAAPTATGLASLLTADKSVIAQAMPASLRTIYGLASAAPAVAAVAPVVAAAVASAATAAVASAATAAVTAPMPPKPASPSVATTSGYASATVASAPAVAPAAAPVVAAPVVVTPVVAAPVIVAPAATAPAVIKPAVIAAPIVSAPVVTAPVIVTPSAPAPAVMKPSVAAAAPMARAPAAAATMASTTNEDTGGTNLLATLGLLVPLLLATAGIWYWAYGTPAPKPAMKTAAVSAPATPPAAAPKPAAAPVQAAAPVAVPGANGMVKYTLPDGAVIEVAADGLEAKLLSFINNKDAIDKKLWFDFDRLSFVTASSDPTPESKSQISSAVAILKAYPAVAVKLGGYTDNQGDPDANMKLSDSRAKRVMADIVASGVAAGRVDAEGYGDQFPIGDNATPEGRAKNRRTSISVRTK